MKFIKLSVFWTNLKTFRDKKGYISEKNSWNSLQSCDKCLNNNKSWIFVYGSFIHVIRFHGERCSMWFVIEHERNMSLLPWAFPTKKEGKTWERKWLEILWDMSNAYKSKNEWILCIIFLLCVHSCSSVKGNVSLSL